METDKRYPSTSVYKKLPKTNDIKSDQLLIFIPGNPGLLDYYTTYLDLIQNQNPNLEILAISQAGFQTTDDFEKDLDAFKFYDLEYQIKHKYEIVKDHVNEGHYDGRNIELFFLAHSVGSYMVQRISKCLIDDESLNGKITIKFIGLICPTIVDIGKSSSGQKFTKLFSILPIQLLLFLISVFRFFLPTVLARMIIGHIIISKPVLDTKAAIESWENSKSATFKLFLSNQIIRQAFTLAKEEIECIHKHEDVNDWFFKNLSQTVKIWCFFALTDHWVHDNTRDYILTNYHDRNNRNVDFQLGSIDNETGHAITHSFCVDQSVEFAELTNSALKW